MPRYKSKIHQVQRKMARTNKADNKQFNKQKLTSTEIMRKLRQRCKVKISSESGIGSTSRAVPRGIIDTIPTRYFIKSCTIITSNR